MTRVFAVLVLVLAGAPSVAEQKVTLGDYEVHYIVIPTTFLRPDVATAYDLTRGKDRSLVNISVLEIAGKPVQAEITGHVRNLLGQENALEFREVVEGAAIYYLAVFKHGTEEHLNFQLNARLPDEKTATIEFRQKMYWEE